MISNFQLEKKFRKTLLYSFTERQHISASEYFLDNLNCPCNLYGSIHYRMHNWPPFIWYIQKCMLIWKIYFYFSFVFAICSSKINTCHITRNRFTEKVLSRWDNFNSCNPFTYTTERAERGWAGLGVWKSTPSFKLQKCKGARVQS